MNRNELLAQAKQLNRVATTEEEFAQVDALIKQVDVMDRTKTPPDARTLRRLEGAPMVVTKKRAYSILRAIKGIGLADRGVDAGLEIEVDQELRRTKDYKGFAVPINAILKTANGQDSLTATPGGVLA